MKKQAVSLNATPSKRLYLSIISDYDLNTYVCELIDNAIDIWIKGGKKKKNNIDIELDTHQQVIKIAIS